MHHITESVRFFHVPAHTTPSACPPSLPSYHFTATRVYFKCEWVQLITSYWGILQIEYFTLTSMVTFFVKSRMPPLSLLRRIFVLWCKITGHLIHWVGKVFPCTCYTGTNACPPSLPSVPIHGQHGFSDAKAEAVHHRIYVSFSCRIHQARPCDFLDCHICQGSQRRRYFLLAVRLTAIWLRVQLSLHVHPHGSLVVLPISIRTNFTCTRVT